MANIITKLSQLTDAMGDSSESALFLVLSWYPWIKSLLGLILFLVMLSVAIAAACRALTKLGCLKAIISSWNTLLSRTEEQLKSKTFLEMDKLGTARKGRVASSKTSDPQSPTVGMTSDHVEASANDPPLS